MSSPAVTLAVPAAARPPSPEQVRLRLRQLDACLERLEGAHERGVTAVPVALATAIRRYVPAVAQGMAITSAIALVMREQEPYLAWAVAARSPSPAWSPIHRDDPAGAAGRECIVMSARPDGAETPALELATEIDETGARELTERIRAATHNAQRLCSLLVEAHDRRAWSVIGYSTWSDYVRSEFRLSRSRSYELLDHGRVLRALEEATGLSGIPDISAYAAAQLKPHLTEVTQAIRVRIAGLPADRVARVAEQVVWEVRSRHTSERRAAQGVLGPNDPTRLFEAVKILAGMPDVTTTVMALTASDAHRLEGLGAAARWLAEFARAWHNSVQEPTGTLDAAS